MSDAHRKDFHTKAKETVTPNFTKSTAQKAKEHATDAADHIARDAQPDSKKSIPQAMFDRAQRASHRVRRRLHM